MNYVELEERLLDSLNRSGPHFEAGTLLELYKILRSVDWLNLFQNPTRNIEAFKDLLDGNPLVQDIIFSLTTIMALRHEEFRAGTDASKELIGVILDSMAWRTTTYLMKDDVVDTVSLDVESVGDILSKSPDLITMYMLSHVGFYPSITGWDAAGVND